MRCKVKLMVRGVVFTETVLADSYEGACDVALSRNPGARLIGVTAI